MFRTKKTLCIFLPLVMSFLDFSRLKECKTNQISIGQHLFWKWKWFQVMVSVKKLIHRINEIESKQGSGGEGKFLKNVL